MLNVCSVTKYLLLIIVFNQILLSNKIFLIQYSLIQCIIVSGEYEVLLIKSKTKKNTIIFRFVLLTFFFLILLTRHKLQFPYT